MANPRSLVHNLYKHWDIVEHLVRLTHESPAFEQAQVLAVVQQHQADAGADEHHTTLQGLLNSDLLQGLPRTNSVQVNHVVLDFVRGLTREHELGLSEVLRARIDAIRQVTAQLADAVQTGDRDLRRLSANRLSELFRQITQQLEQDQDAILKLVEESNSAPDSMPVKRRYKRVLDAFDTYIAPMTDMLDTGVGGAFYRHLEQAEQVLDQAVRILAVEGALYSQQRTMRQVSYQAKALRSQGRQVLKRCTDILLPLRDEVRRHNALSSSISLLLGEVRRKDLRRTLALGKLPCWQLERPSRLSLGTHVLTIMSEAMDFQPTHTPFPEQQTATPETAVEFVDDKAVRAHLLADLPVADMLAWLQTHYGHYSDTTLLRLYNAFLQTDLQTATGSGKIHAAAHARTLRLSDISVTFHPHGIRQHD